MPFDIIKRNVEVGMNFNEKDLLMAQKKGVISAEIFEALLNFLREQELEHKQVPGEQQVLTESIPLPEQNISTTATPAPRRYTLENFLYYFGAFIIINTMGWYLGNVWDSFGHGGLFVLSVVYFLFFTFTGNFLWKKDKKTPGGLLYVCAVSIVPLAVWAFESMVGIMPKNYNDYNEFHIWIRSGWILMELATIFAGLAFLKYRKFSFLMLPICYSMWYLSMDIVPLCLGNTGEPTWGMRNFASIVFSLIMLGNALKLDKKTTENYSFWLYLFGAIMLWGALLSVIMQYKWNNEFAHFIYALFSFGYMIMSVILRQKVFMVLGAIGVFGYIGHLAYTIFKDSAIFPLILVCFGLGIIFTGIYYSKNFTKIEKELRKMIIGK